MINGLLICTGTGKKKNIGDYIQSLAAEQFMPSVDCFVEREKLNSYYSESKTKVIMNGWFMWNPQNWPPANSIEPLFVSFHMVPSIAEKMLSSEGIEYLKKYQPIGCRDYGTVEKLKERGIDAYYSGCLTLTLGKKYLSSIGKDRIVFVDPYYEVYKNENGKKSIIVFMKNFFYGLFNKKKIKKIEKVIKYEITGLTKWLPRLDLFLNASAFYKVYSSMFTDELLFSSTFYTHAVLQNEFKGDEEKFDYAKFLLNEYGKAKFVVTSRIHCALPCLGIETPVIFVTSNNLESKKNPIRSPGRFEGLMDLFRVVRYTEKELITDDICLVNKNNKIDTNFKFENKSEYKTIRDSLIRICEEFINHE